MSPQTPEPAAVSFRPSTRLRIAVMGAGAVGCYYGGMLARAGHDLVLIGRHNHVDAVSARGLRLQTTTFSETVPLLASTEPSAVRGADWVLFCVKSTDTEAAAAAMAPHLAPGARVFSLQNGVDNAQRLRTLLTQTVVPSVVYVAAEMAGPGHVRHHGRGELLFGHFPGDEVMAAVFRDAGIPIEWADDVTGVLWSKLIVNCAYNALSAVTRLPYGPLVAGHGVEQVMRDVVEECLAVARADGVTLPSPPWAAVQQIARTMPTQRSSTAQDLGQGRRTEIDHLNGYVVRRGAAHGIPTPVNRVLHALVRLLEPAPRREP